MFRSSVAVQVVSVAPGPAALGVVVSYLSPRFGSRSLRLAGFPLPAGARFGLTIGQRGRLRFSDLERPLELTIEGRRIWVAGIGLYMAMVGYASLDHRRRGAAFTAYGLPDAETAIGVALTDPPGLPADLQAEWRDAFLTGRRPQEERLIWNWWPGYPPGGRRRNPPAP